ncbi:MAG: FtsB family cell division protein [Suipraeoptans sp.]
MRIKETKRKKQKARNSKINRGSMFAVSGILLVLTIVMATSSLMLKPKVEQQSEMIAELQEQIDNEKQRTSDIDSLEEYIASDAYIEDTAREKLGLVHDNEIVFKSK